MSAICKRLICLVLCLATVLSVTSCQLIESFFDKDETEKDVKKHDDSYLSLPEGYTGGFSHASCYHETTGYYWLETYGEVLEAVELLKSHGSTIKRSAGFNCEGELLDVKWCFMYSWSDADPLERGKSFFDRKIDDGEFVWYAFYKDVTIDELVYSYVSKYDCMSIGYGKYNFSRAFDNVENTSDLSFDWFGKDLYEGFDKPEQGRYMIKYKGEEWAYIDNSNKDRLIPPDYFDEFLSTVVIIE